MDKSKKKRCKPVCKFPKDVCITKHFCNFASGPKRQFCTISNNFKYDSECNLVPKYTAPSNPIIKTTADTKTVTNTPVVTKTVKDKSNHNKTTKPKSIKDKVKKVKTTKVIKNKVANIKTMKKKATASTKIVNFMNKTKHKRTAVFLNVICKDSGQCIAFGVENDKIMKLFNNFKDGPNFYIKNYIKGEHIIHRGDNGEVAEIHFSRHGYDVYSVLKRALDFESDNLYYEYRVGEYINTLNRQVPHFINTYTIYGLKRGKETDDIKQTCDNPLSISILIQHIHNPIYIQTLVETHSPDLLTTLIQVYFTLYVFKNVFTHYDLHGQNVLLYKPKDNFYIHYHYKHGPYNFSFKSQYLAKIIDYGRSFTPISKGIFDIVQRVCTNRKDDSYDEDDLYDDEYHLYNKGYKYFRDPNEYTYHISSVTRNYSHDLRFFNELTYDYNYSGMFDISLDFDPQLKQIYNNLHFTDRYGTEEHSSVARSHKIYNVADAFKQLYKLFMTRQKLNDQHYLDRHKLGDLYIEPGKPSRFIPN